MRPVRLLACAGVACCLPLIAWAQTPQPEPTAPAPQPAQSRTPQAPSAPAAPAGMDDGSVPQAQPAPGPKAPARPRAEIDEDERTELVVLLKDGRRFSGPVVKQDAGSVCIAIAGIPQAFPTEDIEKLEVLPPLMERYRKLHEAVGDDPDRIVDLAEWLRQRRRYELGLTEINHALEIDKTHGPALRLKQLLEQQIILKHQQLKTNPGDAEPKAAAPTAERPINFPLLTRDEIKLIKVYETKLEEKPRVLIERTTVMNLLNAYAGHTLVPITREGREALVRQPALDTLDLMYKLQARDFYPMVEVLDQPHSFTVFRDRVSATWLGSACSTTACHGGTQAGRLMLYTRSLNSDPTVYTNFYILSKFKLADGTPLINWEEPEKSPLLQMALPRGKSRRPHPEVAHPTTSRDLFKPPFQSAEDARFVQAVEWIKMLYRPRPEYPITYVPLAPFEAPKPKLGDEKRGIGKPAAGGGAGGERKPEPQPR